MARSTGIAVACGYAAIAWSFRGPRRLFWNRITFTGMALGAYSLISRAGLRRIRVGLSDAVRGLGSAAALYTVFRVGDGVARAIMPNGAAEIESMYSLRSLRSMPELAARLALVGPAEELFWRGVIQQASMKQVGKWPGMLLGTALYAGAHVGTGNLTLVAAAAVAGLVWGSMYAAGVPMGTLVVSHLAWDIYIFLIAPGSNKATST